MNTRIPAITFNGSVVECALSFSIEDLSINGSEESSPLLSERVRGRVQEVVVGALRRAYPDLAIERVGYRLVSRDLENLRANRVRPDGESLAKAISHRILNEVAVRVGADMQADLDSLRERQPIFRRVFLGEAPRPPAPAVERVGVLFEERRFEEAAGLLRELDMESLSAEERERVAPVELALELRRCGCAVPRMEACYAAWSKRHASEGKLRRKGHMVLVRALEDCRHIHAPRKWLRAFEEKWPVSALMPDERSYYWYSKGRTEYGRGEFIGALELLERAAAELPSGDLPLLAAIQTVAANCLADNLLFEPARRLAEQALETRKRLALADAFESQGALAGIAFKAGRFDEAREEFLVYARMAEELELGSDERNRLRNYLAKSAIMVGDFDEARAHLERAMEDDRLGFSAALWLLWLLHRGEHAAMDAFYAEHFLLPERQRGCDPFALGWAYAFMARAEFARGRWEPGVKYLARAVGFFRADRYHLEAAWLLRYLWEYPLSGEALSLFERIQPVEEILSDLEEYARRHRDLLDRIPTLAEEVDVSPRLDSLFEELAALQSGTAPPGGGRLLDRICLY